MEYGECSVCSSEESRAFSVQDYPEFGMRMGMFMSHSD